MSTVSARHFKDVDVILLMLEAKAGLRRTEQRTADKRIVERIARYSESAATSNTLLNTAKQRPRSL